MSISNDQYWFVVSWWDPEWSWPHLAVFEVLELSNQEADTEDNEMWEVGGNFKVFSWSVSNGGGERFMEERFTRPGVSCLDWSNLGTYQYAQALLYFIAFSNQVLLSLLVLRISPRLQSPKADSSAAGPGQGLYRQGHTGQ